VHLYSMKCINGWSNTSFSMYGQFLNILMPSDASLPKDTYEVKKYMRDLGLGYEKILACRKGCILFWRENEKLDKCTSRKEFYWKDDVTDEDGSTKSLKKSRSKCCIGCLQNMGGEGTRDHSTVRRKRMTMRS